MCNASQSNPMCCVKFDIFVAMQEPYIVYNKRKKKEKEKKKRGAAKGRK